ncbi:MAG TPA: SIMPL domain-containing protein [Candidatus Humimicrobiaceae bacterium]|nr:SIMPL domain-containing protein [Candidatus Humimicrobiaceae bacterium]
MEEFFKEKNECLLGFVLVILGVFLISLIISEAVDIQNKITKTENTITVSDTGEIYAKPDLALTTFSVVNEAKTVAEAMNENTKKMNVVIESVKNQGVEDKDVKTIDFNIYPRYEWYQPECLTYPCPARRRVLVGYEIRQSLQVKIRDMTKIGDIIQEATDAGANQVGDLQFTIDKQDELKAQAREEAIKKTKTKAQELASQLGVKLVRIVNFNEGVSTPYYYDYALKEVVGMGGGEEAPQPQIETGENKISVTVTITYEIR